MVWVYQWQGHEHLHILVREVDAWRTFIQSCSFFQALALFVGLFYRLTRPCLYKYTFLISLLFGVLKFLVFILILFLEVTHSICLYFCFIVEILIIFAQIQQCFLYTVQLHYYVSNFQYSCKGIWWLGIPHIISQILARIGGTVGHNIDRWITVLSLVSMQPG